MEVGRKIFFITSPAAAMGNSRTILCFGPGAVIYSTTYLGGSDLCYMGCGTIFQLTPPMGGGSWTKQTLFDFTGSEERRPSCRNLPRSRLRHGVGAERVGWSLDKDHHPRLSRGYRRWAGGRIPISSSTVTAIFTALRTPLETRIMGSCLSCLPRLSQEAHGRKRFFTASPERARTEVIPSGAS